MILQVAQISFLWSTRITVMCEEDALHAVEPSEKQTSLGATAVTT